jgi:hypothetical protein
MISNAALMTFPVVRGNMSAAHLMLPQFRNQDCALVLNQ